MDIRVEKFYTVELLRDNPDSLFVFGDNTHKVGKGGQAIIRDEPNAFGIATKVSPNIYFTDELFYNNVERIDYDILCIEEQSLKYKEIVFPKDGLGTGLAKLKEKAPKTYRHLRKELLIHFDFDNVSGKVITEYLDKNINSSSLEIEQLAYILTSESSSIDTDIPIQAFLRDCIIVHEKLIRERRWWNEYICVYEVGDRYFEMIDAKTTGDRSASEQGFEITNQSIKEVFKKEKTVITEYYD
jgi:hypothetical protein